MDDNARKPTTSQPNIGKTQGLFRRTVTPLLARMDKVVLKKKFFDAVYTQNVPDVERLLAAGVDPNFHDADYGGTPLHLLAERNDCALAAVLLAGGQIDMEVRSNHGNTALHLTCYLNCGEFAALLLGRGANPNAVDAHDRTPLHVAVERGHQGIAAKLLEHGAAVNVMDSFDETPLSLSILGSKDIAIARLLFKYGADMSLEGRKDLHVFFEVILGCHTLPAMDFVPLLLENGVDINMQQPSSGRNCLHFVAISGFEMLAVVLVEKGANVRARDHLSRTPAQVAKCHQNYLLASYFKRQEKGSTLEASAEILPRLRWIGSEETIEWL